MSKYDKNYIIGKQFALLLESAKNSNLQKIYLFVTRSSYREKSLQRHVQKMIKYIFEKPLTISFKTCKKNFAKFSIT